MDNQQARFILQSYRPNGQDAADPAFAEALQQARQDPVLSEWFAKECRLDAAISAKVRAIPVPADLKGMILAGHQASAVPVRWFPLRTWAIAAAAALLVGLAAIFWPRTPHPSIAYAAYWQQVIQLVSAKDFKLEFKAVKLEQMQAWLASRGAPSDVNLPSNLAQLPGMGCRTLVVDGHTASFFCFVADGNQMLHLIVIEKSMLRDPPPEASPQFAQGGAWSTASWSQGSKSYLLTSTAGTGFLQRFL
ncbi:MAG: hypothetical protein HY360_24105 [Verrucomicrobia bacterium]|nr:hypothetical protein [Verrucomicrobiota bacterium]